MITTADDVRARGSRLPSDGPGVLCGDASSRSYDVVGHGAGQPAEARSVPDALDRWEKRLLQTVPRRDPESAVPR